MSYKALINSNLNRAFRLVKDLAEDVVYVQKPMPSFDFATGAQTPSPPLSTLIPTIVIDGKKSSRVDSGHAVKSKQIMFKSKDVNIGLYDYIMLEGEEWKLGAVVQDSGFVALVNISKGV